MTNVVVLGGGVAGLAAARQLDRLFLEKPDVQITLVSRDNFFLLTPLLFEACSGVLEFRHCAQSIRPCLKRARFLEAEVRGVDVDKRVVTAQVQEGHFIELPYDHLLVALGSDTNLKLVRGSQHAFTFRTAADALKLRTHIIERFERADTEPSGPRRRQLLTFVIVGGGLVGVELLGEITAFAADILRYYPRIRKEEVEYHLFEAGNRILPESAPFLASYAEQILGWRGAQLHLSTPVESIEPGRLHVAGRTIEADTVVMCAGIVINPIAAQMNVERDKRGRITTDACMRSTSHPDVWALGDCASVPGPDGVAYPALAQHATREGNAVARNVFLALRGGKPRPFVFDTLGSMAAFGHTRAAVDLMGIPLRGFLAWWIRRTYYLFQIPRWDTRVRIALDWTVALFFRPDTTKVELADLVERR